MKKHFLLFPLMLLSIVAVADPIEIDGIYYTLSSESNSAGVAGSNNTDCIIPESITYEGIKYDVTSINANAFNMNDRLISISIPSSIKSIGDYAFHECKSITAVHISDLAAWCNIDFGKWGDSNPLGLAQHLYLKGEEITELVIPDIITEIKDNTFRQCISINTIQFPNDLTSIGESAFAGCSNLSSITIPNKVTSIGNSAFSNCQSLTNVNILNDNVNETLFIGLRAFSSCANLSSIIIGPGSTAISSQTFAWCSKLSDVYCYKQTSPSVYYNSFQESNVENATLHVPESSLDAYKATSPWSEFGKKVALTSDDPKPTGIDGIRSNITDIEDAYYDLNGRRVMTPTQKGIYIKGGKKVVVK